MTQREGRILRQVNENKQVEIYRYITKGSFDAYSWQLLETKQRFITALLSGSMTERSGSDIESTVLDYAEVKALAVGDPLLKKRVEAANELARYRTLQRDLVEKRMRWEAELLELPGRKQRQAELICSCQEDWQAYKHIKRPDPKDKAEAGKRRDMRSRISTAVRENILRAKETYLMDYRGFRIILPAHMTEEKPYICLEGRGRYEIALGDKEIGILARIDHFLDGLGEHLERLKAGLYRLEQREEELKAELAKDESYAEKIDEYRKRLENLDKKLGVDAV